MSAGLYRQVAALLAAHGFSLAGQRGSHQKWKNDAGLAVALPVTLVSRHTGNAILRQAGISAKI
ncbi:MAG: type II toxin-antitoxin system HicA family toxin [Candidatus Accumulibacter sp.]|jgi:predicted RNA binding protein YcfA (HicA-like mRNA interferase family)|nr:type II toxin-antitoxin system HicA family toxin [Accumulibacter sp.]